MSIVSLIIGEVVEKVAGDVIDAAANAIEKSMPKNAADDQRLADSQRIAFSNEADRLKELENVAVLGGAHD